MRIAGRTQMLSLDYSVDEMLPRFHDAGFDAVEFCLEDLRFHPRPDSLEDYFISHVVDLAQRNRLKIGAVSCHVDFVGQDRIFRLLKKAVVQTTLFGTDILIVASGDRGPDTDDASGPVRFRERLTELLRLAEQHKVRIALEPEPGHRVDSTASFLALWDELDRHPALYCNFDIGHAHLLDPDIGDSIRALADRIAHVHIENMGDVHNHLLPWEGEIDLDHVIRVLKDSGFDGSMAFDYYNDAYESVMSAVAADLQERVRRAGA